MKNKYRPKVDYGYEMPSTIEWERQTDRQTEETGRDTEREKES